MEILTSMFPLSQYFDIRHSSFVSQHDGREASVPESQREDGGKDDEWTDGRTLERSSWARLKLKMVKTDAWVNIYLSGATVMPTHISTT